MLLSNNRELNLIVSFTHNFFTPQSTQRCSGAEKKGILITQFHFFLCTRFITESCSG